MKCTKISCYKSCTLTKSCSKRAKELVTCICICLSQLVFGRILQDVFSTFLFFKGDEAEHAIWLIL